VDVELSRAEAELQHEASALQTELTKLATVGAEIDARLAAARQLVGQAASTGVSDAGLSARLEAAHVPPVPGAEAFAKAQAAREAAIHARREAHAQVKQQLTALKRQLTMLAQQVMADEKAAQALLARAQSRPMPVAPAPPPPPVPSRASPTVTQHPPGLAPQAPAPAKKAFDGRESQRIQHRVRMQAAVDFGSDNNFFNGFSANISDGGLFVATVNLLPIGTEIELHFSLPSGERIQAQGVVRWVREVSDKHPDAFPGIGVQFTRLDEQAQAAVERFVHSREPMFYVEG
jgi:uncharacterized protein (TIGR02266 family)